MFTVNRTVNGSTLGYPASDFNEAQVLASTLRTGIRQSGAMIEVLAPDGVFIMGWEYDGQDWSSYVSPEE